jgi:type I restriction enzyme S subunit
MLKGYSKYKDTDYDWLPQVPSHWEEKTIRSITKLSDKRCGSRVDLELLSVYREYGVIKKKSRDDNHNVESENLSNYKYVKKGNLVLNKMKMWQGSLGISEYDGIVSPAYIVCDLFTNANLKYLQFLLRSPSLKTFYNRVSYGIRVGQWDMHYADFKSLCLYLPPHSEQDQIVRYLDWKISMINKYINAKKKQIELLKKRILTYLQISIESKNTKKLRLKNIVFHEFDEIAREEDTPYTPIGVLNKGRGIFHKPSLLGCDLGDSTFHWVKKDVLVLSGQFAWEGAVALSGDSELGCIASHRYYTLRAKKEIVLNSYLWAYLISQDGEIILNMNSIGAAGRNRPLNINHLLRESVPVPPMQYQIILDKYISEYLSFIKFAKQSEILLKEYSTRLISDVVTGRVDVQGEKVPEFTVKNEDSPGIGQETEGDIDDE